VAQSTHCDLLPVLNSNNDKITDIEAVSSNYFSSLRTKSVIEPKQFYDAFPEASCVPSSLKMDFSRILHKPYFFKNITWVTTDTQYAILNTMKIPVDVVVSKLAQIPFDASALYRCKISLLFQISGTPMHQGCLIVAASPDGFMNDPGMRISSTVNSLMCQPHVFLNANEATAVALEVPFYVNSILEMSNIDGKGISPNFPLRNFAEVTLFVINPLLCPTSAATSVSISVYAVFTEMEFYVPHVEPTWVTSSFEAEGLLDSLKASATKGIDGIFTVGRQFTSDLLDNARSAIRYYTGLHAPNSPTLVSKNAVVLRQNLNQVDAPSSFEKLDPYSNFDRIFRDFNFDTTTDEMLVHNIISKPQYIGSFLVKTADTAGTLCWSRPISPIQESFFVTSKDIETGNTVIQSVGTSVQRTMALMSKYWRGSINLHIQAVMSNFHFCKLSVARNYNPSPLQLTSFPSFVDVNNLMVEVIEFSGGGQVQTIQLPYCSTMNQLMVSTDWALNSLQHGQYYIYLNQPLVTNGSVSTSISFNVYISAGDDFQFFGYPTLPLNRVITNLNVGPPTSLDDGNADTDGNFQIESASATVVVNSQKDLLLPETEVNELGYTIDHRPIVSMRDIGRRMYRNSVVKIGGTTQFNNQGVFYTSLTTLLGRFYGSGEAGAYSIGDTASVTPLGVLSSMYLGYRGGLKIKLVVTGATNVVAYFVPPGQVYNSNLKFSSTSPIPSVSNEGAGLNTVVLQNEFKPFLLNPGSQSIRLATTVSLERPNWINTSSNIINQSDSAHGFEKQMAASAIVEFEVPYMSPYRYVGSMASYNPSTTAGLLANGQASCDDLGYLVIGAIPNLSYQASLEDAITSLSVDFYCSMDDTARFGYQVIAPMITIPATATGVGINTIQAIPYTSYVNGTPNTPYSAPSTVAPFAYFTKLT